MFSHNIIYRQLQSLIFVGRILRHFEIPEGIFRDIIAVTTVDGRRISSKEGRRNQENRL